MDDASTPADPGPRLVSHVGRPSHLVRWAAILFAAICVVSSCHDQGATAATPGSPIHRATVQLLTLPKSLRSNVDFTAVSCVDRSYCIAVGVSLPPSDTGGAPGFWPTGDSVIARFNGRTWSTMDPPPLSEAGLNGVSCISRTNCIAVGEQFAPDGDGSTLVEQYSGTGWNTVPSPNATDFPRNSNFLQSISCVSTGQCVAVGGDYNVSAGRAEVYAPLVERQSSEGWVITPLPSPTTGHFTSVSCSLAQCVAVGDGTTSDVKTTAGSWTALADYTSPGLSGVACSSGASCTGVGQSSPGAGLSVAKLAGMTWSRVSGPETANPTATNTLSAVSCFGSRSCVAVGQFIGSQSPANTTTNAFGPLVAVETQGAWSVPPAVGVSPVNEPWLPAVSCPTVHECLAVGTTLLDAVHAQSSGFRSIAMVIHH